MPVKNVEVCKVLKNSGLANNSILGTTREAATISNNGSSLVNASVSIIMILMNASEREETLLSCPSRNIAKQKCH